MASVAQRLSWSGIPMREYPQTVPNLTAAGSNLYELIKSGSLLVYPDDELRLAVSRTVALETPRGLRLAKEKQSHKIDVVVALAMACMKAVEQGGVQDVIVMPILCRAPRRYFGDIGSSYMEAPHLQANKSNWPVW
jgi:phage terminase large subunit-like protein